MYREDNDGKWLIENGFEILVEPSELWIIKNQPTPTTEQLLEPIRINRNILLAECDWTQLSDCVLSAEKKAEWVIYRQTLRDLPETINVNNPVYPTKPE